MTSELEQEFYDTFGIEPKNKCGKNLIYPNCLNPDKCGYDNCIYYQIEYPDITAEKLLEMICILNKHYAENFQCATILVGDTIEKIKECILKDCIEQSQHIKSEIQQLFKD